MLGRLSKGLWIFTVVVIAWNTSTSANKVETAMRDVMGAVVGISDSIAMGALAGAFFGPIGAIIGGILGGLLSDTLLDWFEAHAPTLGQANATMMAVP